MKRIKRFMVIMDSMLGAQKRRHRVLRTDAELDCEAQLMLGRRELA